MTRLGLIAAAALLASTGLAVAQSSNSSSSPNDVSASQGKCWDSVAKQVRDQSTQGSEAGRSSTGSSTASGNTSAGTGTSVGAGSSSSGGTGSSGGTTGSLAGASGSSGTGGTSSTGTASSSGSGSSGSGTGSTNRPAEAMGSQLDPAKVPGVHPSRHHFDPFLHPAPFSLRPGDGPAACAQPSKTFLGLAVE